MEYRELVDVMQTRIGLKKLGVAVFSLLLTGGGIAEDGYGD